MGNSKQWKIIALLLMVLQINNSILQEEIFTKEQSTDSEMNTPEVSHDIENNSLRKVEPPEPRCQITVSRKSNQPDRYSFQSNGTDDEASMTSACGGVNVIKCDATSSKEGDKEMNDDDVTRLRRNIKHCNCGSVNETFYVNRRNCETGGTNRECRICFASSLTQVKLVDLMNSHYISDGLMRCQDDNPPPPIKQQKEKGNGLSSTENEMGLDDCNIVEIFYENVQQEAISRWLKLEIKDDSKFKMYYQDGSLKWSGTDCELKTLSGLVLRFDISCKGLMEKQCIVVKTSGVNKFYSNEPKKIQKEFDQCQQSPSKSPSTFIKPSTSVIVPTLGLFTTPTLILPTKVLSTPSHHRTPYVPTLSAIPTLTDAVNSKLSPVSMTTVSLATTRKITSKILSRHIFQGASIQSVSFVGMQYPYVNTRGNNDVIILIAAVTAGISIGMILVTAFLVFRRDQREKKESGDDYSEYSTCDDRSRSESMFENVRKAYIVEKRGSLDYNLNVGTPLPIDRRKGSILKNNILRKENDSDRLSIDTLRPRNKSSSSSITPTTTPTKIMCDCATYTGHDIPSLVSSPVKSVSLNDISLHRRRKTWNWFDASKAKKKKYAIAAKKDERAGGTTVETVTLKRMRILEEPHAESFVNAVHDETSKINTVQVSSSAQTELGDMDKTDTVKVSSFAQTDATEIDLIDTQPVTNQKDVCTENGSVITEIQDNGPVLREAGDTVDVNTGILNRGYSSSGSVGSPPSSPVMKDNAVQVIAE